MRDDPELRQRIAAAGALLDRDHPDVVPAMLEEWARFTPDSPKGGRVQDEFEELVDLLVASGRADALKALSEGWARLGPAERFSMVQALGGYRTTTYGPKRKPSSTEARDEAVALLVRALDDTTVRSGLSGSLGDFVFSSPRICDMAAWALHRIEPDMYSFSKKPGRRQRDLERVTMANVWRKKQHLEALPLPLSPPKLEPKDALKITHWADLSEELEAGAELREKMSALVGTDFKATTLPTLLQWFASTPVKGIGGVKIEALRYSDLRGVELELQMEPGDYPAGGDALQVSLDGTVGERRIGNSSERASLTDQRDDRYWQDFVAELTSALNVPPDTEFVIGASADWPITF
jgi:hypothetical protein